MILKNAYFSEMLTSFDVLLHLAPLSVEMEHNRYIDDWENGNFSHFNIFLSPALRRSAANDNLFKLFLLTSLFGFANI